MACKGEQKVISKLADIPLAKPGFDTLDMTAPVLVQLNTNGKWENAKPATLDEDKLRAVVEHLVNSKALSAAQSYCCQCAAENRLQDGTGSNYVPVIMMPLYPADKCPFDMSECETEKNKQKDALPKKHGKSPVKAPNTDSKDEKDKKKKKRGFVMQRLTDFDLLSQW